MLEKVVFKKNVNDSYIPKKQSETSDFKCDVVVFSKTTSCNDKVSIIIFINFKNNRASIGIGK